MSIVFNKSKEISLDDETLRSDLLKIASGMNNVIALGRGDPDFHTPRHIVEAAKKALDENKHHYAHMDSIKAPLPDEIYKLNIKMTFFEIKKVLDYEKVCRIVKKRKFDENVTTANKLSKKFLESASIKFIKIKGIDKIKII